MSRPAYPKYKPSGVEWLGDVPEKWTTKKIKYLFRFVSGGTPSTNDESYWDGNIPWVSSKDMKVLYIADTEDHINERAIYESAASLVPAGTILLVTRSGILRHTIPVAVTQCAMAINQDIKGLLPKKDKISADYFARFIQGVQDQLLSLWRKEGTTVESLELELIADFQMVLPFLDEQQAIAAFLDRETGRIDGLIEKKERQIELLREKRAALISHAVTKGLDPKAPLKDSGIEWLGQIPKHWDMKHIKHMTKILRGKFTHRPRNDPRMYDGPYPFIQTGDVSSVSKFIVEYHQTLSEDGLAVSKMFPKGTLVMTIAANIGDMAILNFEACFPDSIVGFLPSRSVDLNFLYYLFIGLRPALMGTATLNTQFNLNIDRIGAIMAVQPSLQEQRRIVEFLDSESERINGILAKVEYSIDKLREYRTALISAAVTGKIDVRNNFNSEEDIA